MSVAIDKELIDYGKDKESKLLKLSEKRHVKEGKEATKRLSEHRNDAERDHARILYSSSFRRLQGKMQLFIPYSNRFNRNRLTHSLEVAQIARVIAKKLNLTDILTVESCALAHDIGHPPFGHSGEHTLFKIGQNIKFEGNAQTFRILNHLEEKHYNYNGLNLTYRTLLGVVKYFDKYNGGQNRKYLYDEDYDLIKEIKDLHNIKDKKTIDAEIMDIADEIAYAAHDLEDAFYFKWFTIDELLYEFSISKEYKPAHSILEKIVKNAKKFAFHAKAYETSEEYLILFKKELTSLIVDELVKSLCIKNNVLSYSKDYDLLAEGLKKLTYSAVSRSPKVKLYEQKGENIVSKLYEVYMDTNFNNELKLLPADYRDKKNWEQSVIDYISGMMDNYAITKYKELFGEKSLDKLYTN